MSKLVFDESIRMRGIEQLIMGEEILLNLLKEEVVKTNKIRAFFKIKEYVLNNFFDDKSLLSFVQLSKALKNKLVCYRDVEGVGRALLEKILRDFVPLNSVEVFMNTVNAIHDYTGDEEQTCYICKRYAQLEIKSIAKIYKELFIVSENKKIGGKQLCKYLGKN